MCKVTATLIAADGQAVAIAIDAIATQVKITNPTLSGQLTTAAATLVAVTSGWETGSTVTDINTAATAIESVLDVIPATAPYANFVAIAVAALDILIGNLSTQSAQTSNIVTNALLVFKNSKNLPVNHWRGAVKIKRHFREDARSAFIRYWNEAVDKNPDLKFPKL